MSLGLKNHNSQVFQIYNFFINDLTEGVLSKRLACLNGLQPFPHPLYFAFLNLLEKYNFQVKKSSSTSLHALRFCPAPLR
jgi:hypothetical protein